MSECDRIGRQSTKYVAGVKVTFLQENYHYLFGAACIALLRAIIARWRGRVTVYCAAGKALRKTAAAASYSAAGLAEPMRTTHDASLPRSAAFFQTRIILIMQCD